MREPWPSLEAYTADVRDGLSDVGYAECVEQIGGVMTTPLEAARALVLEYAPEQAVDDLIAAAKAEAVEPLDAILDGIFDSLSKARALMSRSNEKEAWGAVLRARIGVGVAREALAEARRALSTIEEVDRG